VLNYLINRAALRSRVLRLTPVDTLRRQASAARRRDFRPDTDLSAAAGAVLAGVDDRGVHLLPAAAELLGNDATTIERLIANGVDGWEWNGDGILESDEVCNQDGEAYRLGLNSTLLDLAEQYIGERCFYMGCSLKREDVSSFKGGTRQWHLDIEDDRMLRIIIYLNNVEEGGGPFQYIEAPRSRLACSQLVYRSGYISDATMRSAVEEARWNSAYGPAGLIVAFDGTRVFHRVARPTSKARLSLSLTYTSRHPRHVFRQVRLRLNTCRSALSDLSERERACLPGARWT